MLFNSYIFILIYLPIVLLGFYSISKYTERGAILWLLISSIVFYSWWSLGYTIILIISMTVNYFFGYTMSNVSEKKIRKLIFIFSVAFNLIYLGYFKYFNFILDSIDFL